RMVGNGMANLVRRSVADTEIDCEEALRRMKRYYVAHLLDTTCLYPGVAQGVAELYEKNAVLTLVSNKPEAACKAILDGLGIGKFFRAIVGGDGEFPLKPAPDSLLALAAKFNAAPSECWIVGDNYTDLEAGRRAGFRRVFISCGFGEAGRETPDFTAGSFDEFMMIIRGF
ncbi:MAG: HAD-IA family hydrolase, partial [Victivallaceae bacterium]|nr:HAD-IA family hydrolase [Victivallaceae bacterium]